MRLFKKIYAWLVNHWHAETPKLSRFMQFLSIIVSFAPLYYNSLPVDFQQTIPRSVLLWFSIVGFFVALFFQFTKKKH